MIKEADQVKTLKHVMQHATKPGPVTQLNSTQQQSTSHSDEYLIYTISMRIRQCMPIILEECRYLKSILPATHFSSDFAMDCWESEYLLPASALEFSAKNSNWLPMGLQPFPRLASNECAVGSVARRPDSLRVPTYAARHARNKMNPERILTRFPCLLPNTFDIWTFLKRQDPSRTPSEINGQDQLKKV